MVSEDEMGGGRDAGAELVGSRHGEGPGGGYGHPMVPGLPAARPPRGD